MQLQKTLRTLLIIQVLTWLWVMQVTYSSSHNGGHNGLADLPLAPMLLSFGGFILLGAVNLVLLTIYLVKTRQNKQKGSKPIMVLAAIVILLALILAPTAGWLDKLGGNSFLPDNNFEFYNK